jgi:hypothetical protein
MEVPECSVADIRRMRTRRDPAKAGFPNSPIIVRRWSPFSFRAHADISPAIMLTWHNRAPHCHFFHEDDVNLRITGCSLSGVSPHRLTSIPMVGNLR